MVRIALHGELCEHFDPRRPGIKLVVIKIAGRCTSKFLLHHVVNIKNLIVVNVNVEVYVSKHTLRRWFFIILLLYFVVTFYTVSLYRSLT